MKGHMSKILATIFSLCCAAFIGSTSFAQDNKEKPAAPSNDEMTKKMQEYATPGAGHKVLDSLAGEWTIQARFWIGGAPPQESKGAASAKWILGRRYLQEDFAGEMMQMPFRGLGTTAYDNFKKKYISTWIDTMGTGIFISEGTADDSGKTLTFLGKMDEPATGEKDKPAKYIIHIEGPDKHTMEMHDLSLGDKSKVMELFIPVKPPRPP
jgi:hypothetical protein